MDKSHSIAFQRSFAAGALALAIGLGGAMATAQPAPVVHARSTIAQRLARALIGAMLSSRCA